MLLTAETLLNFQRCSRRAFLDAYGDSSQKDPPNDYLLKILQDSREHRQDVLRSSAYHHPHYASGDWQAGAEATLRLMQQGVERIEQAVLITEVDGVTLVSTPDVLIQQPGHSVFGDWIYVPQEIKLSKRAKTEYQILVAYHAKVLAAVQGAWGESAFLVLKEKGLYSVDLWEMLPRMEAILADCMATLRQSEEPEVFISRNRCSLCHWYSHCYSIAKGDSHLSLLPGVTQSRYVELQNLQVTTVEALANLPAKHLEPLPGFGRAAATRLVRQAQATLKDQALPGDEFPDSGQHLRFLEEELPSAAVELYFDIESEPALDLIYLHGVLVVDRRKQTSQFHPFLADRPQDEQQVWQQFLEFVWAYPTAPIFHFCPYEVQTVSKLAQIYDTPASLIQPLLPRFVDLHDVVTRVATLPVESYALKPIARWVGFDWRDASANGAQSIYWYTQWLATGERSFLQSILAYNEDDCRATHHIKDWLVEFVHQGQTALLAS
jgi:uncharacterized protein